MGAFMNKKGTILDSDRFWKKERSASSTALKMERKLSAAISSPDDLALHRIAELFQCLSTPSWLAALSCCCATAELQFHLDNSPCDLLETTNAALVMHPLWQKLPPARGMEAGCPGETSILSHRACRTTSKMQPGRLSGDEKRHLIRTRDLISAPFADLGQRLNKRKLSATNM